MALPDNDALLKRPAQVAPQLEGVPTAVAAQPTPATTRIPETPKLGTRSSSCSGNQNSYQLAVNLDSDLLHMHYSLDAGGTFTTLTDGALDPSRGVASMRLVLSNDLSQDNILLDRVYLSI